MAKGRILKQGDIINIYQKPVTEEDLEGKAKLIKLIHATPLDTFNRRSIEDWEVRFEGETETYRRTVLV